MQLFLEEVASRYPDEQIIRCWRALTWHKGQPFSLPANRRLWPLPPYAPELNPVEPLWDDRREKSFHNRVFDRLDALKDHLEAALRALEKDPARIPSITAWPWIVKAQ